MAKGWALEMLNITNNPFENSDVLIFGYLLFFYQTQEKCRQKVKNINVKLIPYIGAWGSGFK